MALLLVIISAAFVNNVVLIRFLGLCPFAGASTRVETAAGMALATGFVLTLASILSYLLHHFLLEPFGLEYLRTLTFILVIGAAVQWTEMTVRRTSPVLHQALGIFLPLITTNCAVLGVALLNVNQGHGFVGSVLFGAGSALGFGIVIVLLAGARERLERADVPTPFRGPAIGLVTAGLMALAFMGFSGLDKP